MAKYVVPPRTCIVRCRNCKTLYAPDPKMRKPWGNGYAFEICPTCGEAFNNWNDTIPLWKYKFIRFFRGLMRDE